MNRRVLILIASMTAGSAVHAGDPAAVGSEGAAPAGGPAITIAPDAAREKAIADSLTAKVKPEAAVWLDVDGTRVLALFVEQTTATPKGAVLILHGIDGNPDMPPLIHTLRTELPEAGWSTLSVQLPVLPPGSPREAYGGTLEAAAKRAQAALAYVRGRQIQNIAIVGHGLGAAAGLKATTGTEVRAFAALSLVAAEGLNPAANTVAAIEKLKLPVLDLYGTLGAEIRLKLADRRAAAARRARNAGYIQARMPGADDEFTGMDEAVARRVRGWLDKAALGMTASPARR